MFTFKKGILLFMFLFNSPFGGGYTVDDLDPDKFKTCTFSSVEFKSMLEKKGYNTKIQYNSTSLIPEIQNLNCIGKVEKLNFDEKIVIVEDSDLWFRISCHHKTKFIDKATFIYNIHDDNSINIKNNAYLTRLKGLKRTYSKPEKFFLKRKEIKTILNNCYFGIQKYHIARNEFSMATKE